MKTFAKSLVAATAAFAGFGALTLPAFADNTMNAPAYYRADSKPFVSTHSRTVIDTMQRDPRNSASKDGRGYTFN